MKIWKFWSSPRRELYIRLARQYRTTPWKVYNLAHGSRTRCNTDLQVLKELEKEGVIAKIYPW